ncbi:uncharacterized protein LOC103716305 [Phoenix dactylifera]|uniref:Uncharacterized protein LOC103716305 n=1 Tax=Phoenix dactylifera TaxID=42345 RepID=A0A8B7CMX1_PHODC|nr:uncharacterized protein LOC103716305 [Phoenix dactylifera]
MENSLVEEEITRSRRPKTRARARAKPPPSGRGRDSRIESVSPPGLVSSFEKNREESLRNRSAMVMSVDPAAGEVEVATCEFCGLTEDCTQAYIARVRERYGGLWVCGLCRVAVEEEIERSGRRMSKEEAMTRHASFLRNFWDAAASPVNPTHLLIAALRRLLRRILDSPRTPDGPHRWVEVAGAALARSGR